MTERVETSFRRDLDVFIGYASTENVGGKSVTEEYVKIEVAERVRWLQCRIDAIDWHIEHEARRRILNSLIVAEEFERFGHARFGTQKRFSLEGADTALAIFAEILKRAAENNVQEVVMGMAHRGRLNIRANVIGGLKAVLAEFLGKNVPASIHAAGDVKYHLGATGSVKYANGNEISVLLMPNPSHLEAVNPVVEGFARSRQNSIGDIRRERVIPVIIHGDAAFAGQGVVTETLNLSQLDGYATGGTIHLIINNQIGFTTLPDEARSTSYCTDVVRGFDILVLHVNGDDPDSAISAAHLAFDYRQHFKKDVVIDMICYRRQGHNEQDEPSFTQPALYHKIKQHPSVSRLYAERLMREGVIQIEEVNAVHEAATRRLNEAYDAVQSGPEVQGENQ